MPFWARSSEMHKSLFRCLKVDINISKCIASGTLKESNGITGRITAIFEHAKRIIEKCAACINMQGIFYNVDMYS